MNLSRHAYASAGILIFLTVASAGSTHWKASATKPLEVVVTNPAMNPVQVSGLVTVANPASNPVEVSGLVTVANPANNPVQVSGLVTVANTHSNPVQVTEPAKTAFNQEFELDLANGASSGGATEFTVPTGKMLVLTNEYVNANMPAGELLLHATINTNAQFIPLNFTNTGSDGVDQFFNGRSDGAIYIPAGNSVAISAYRSSATGPATLRVGFDGYLVDAS